MGNGFVGLFIAILLTQYNESIVLDVIKINNYKQIFAYLRDEYMNNHNKNKELNLKVTLDYKEFILEIF